MPQHSAQPKSDDRALAAMLADIDDGPETPRTSAEIAWLAALEDELLAAVAEPLTGKVGKSGDAPLSLGVPEGATSPISEGTSVRSENQNQTSRHTTTHLSPSSDRTDTGPTSAPSTNRKIERTDVELRTRPTIRKRTAMAPYEDLKGPARIVLAHDELLGHGEVLGFTLNISPKVWAAALASGDPANHISKKVRYRLQAAGLPWLGWFAIEIEAGLPHIHGACLGTPEQAEAIRRAMRKAAGEWNDARQHQCKTSADPDFGWVTYAAKDFGKAIATKLYGPDCSRIISYPFTSKPFWASAELSKSAKARYNEQRDYERSHGKTVARPGKDDKSLLTEVSVEARNAEVANERKCRSREVAIYFSHI